MVLSMCARLICAMFLQDTWWGKTKMCKMIKELFPYNMSYNNNCWAYVLTLQIYRSYHSWIILFLKAERLGWRKPLNTLCIHQWTARERVQVTAKKKKKTQNTQSANYLLRSGGSMGGVRRLFINNNRHVSGTVRGLERGLWRWGGCEWTIFYAPEMGSFHNYMQFSVLDFRIYPLRNSQIFPLLFKRLLPHQSSKQWR